MNSTTESYLEAETPLILAGFHCCRRVHRAGETTGVGSAMALPFFLPNLKNSWSARTSWTDIVTISRDEMPLLFWIASSRPGTVILHVIASSRPGTVIFHVTVSSRPGMVKFRAKD